MVRTELMNVSKATYATKATNTTEGLHRYIQLIQPRKLDRLFVPRLPRLYVSGWGE